MQKLHIDYGLHLCMVRHICIPRAMKPRNGKLKMTTNVTYRTATPSEVDRILARANAERSAFIASLATKASAKLRGLFAKTPRGAVPA
ncbi:MAG: hypothetical protein ACI80I_003294 [Akkermansiaceae bacterium]|jgi:hypothetical protein